MGADPVGAAAEAVRAGRPVIVPTDTVYGLCSTPYREDAALRIARLKGRDAATPLALVAADVDLLLECVPELRGRAAVAVRALLPGALTLVLPNPARRFRWLSGARPETIGVRVPALEGPGRGLLDRVGALVATSANEHGGADPARLADVPEQLRRACAAELDGGSLPGRPSTVIDLTGPEPTVLREGAVPADEALARIAAAAT
jgi:L-threonylcarbamoyladenylate synthase